MNLYRITFPAMACENELQIYAPGAQVAGHIASKAVAEVKRIERDYSRYREESIISRINSMAGKDSVAVNEETASLLRLADSCFHTSRGLFDITSGVLRQIWDFRSGVPPTDEVIAAILPRIGWDKVEWSGTHIRLPQEKMEIDFGGIGKEYAADRAALILRAEGVTHGLVNLGGDIHVLGPHADGSPWAVHISHPRQPGTILTTLELAQGALTTSGDYQRYFIHDGRHYCHILNPKTGWPVTCWQSATVIAPLCVAAGSASTIAMLWESEAPTFLEKRNMSYLLVDQQGQLRQKIQAGLKQHGTVHE